jgi:phage-related protein
MKERNKYREILLYKDYFEDFFRKQTMKIQDKILWTLKLVRVVEHVPDTYLKHIEGTNGLYEIRVQSGNNIFRIFCFFDKGNLVVVANGFQKKTKKTPKNEIELALKIKLEYENEE